MEKTRGIAQRDQTGLTDLIKLSQQIGCEYNRSINSINAFSKNYFLHWIGSFPICQCWARSAFRSAVTHADIETCLVKLFSLTAELKREYPTVTIEAPAHLWILAAEVSDRLLQEFTIGLDPEFGEGFYQTQKGFRMMIVAINELPSTPDTLWIRLMGKGIVQESAIEELILLRDTDLKQANALNLLVSWRISIELTNQLESEEKRTLMALSQAYLEWEKQTRRQSLELGIIRGLEQGLEQERRSTIINLMRLRYGVIDSTLEQVIPRLMAMSNEDYTRVLLNLSKSELIEQLQN